MLPRRWRPSTLCLFLMVNDSILTLLGVLLVSLVVYDIYDTILHARGNTGPISETLNRGVWGSARFVAFRLSRQQRHRFLNHIGPLLLPLLVITYILLLVAGFALVYYPRMPAQFTINAEAASPAWVEAIYFSGTTLATLGYGDITPHTLLMRLVALVEGASGFAIISLAVTYLITVYRALELKRTVALSFYHQADEGADAASFVAHHFVAGRFYGLDTALRTARLDIQELLEAHFEHPVIHYFHPVEVYRNMPRVLFLLLETCAVIRACLDEKEYAELRNHPEIRTLESSARYVLSRLIVGQNLKPEAAVRTETSQDESERWQRRFRQTMRRLAESGVKTRIDAATSWEKYSTRRAEWEAQLYLFSTYLGYEWDEVTGDNDLRHAAETEEEINDMTIEQTR